MASPASRITPAADHWTYAFIKPTSRGAIGNLVLRQLRGPEGELPICNAQIQVAAVGLNFRDVLNVLGEYPGDPGQPGLDCAGTVS